VFLLFPTRSEKAIYGMPWFTIGTIALCVLLQAARYGVDLSAFAYVPANGFSFTLLTCAFLHGGLVHLAGNMAFLWCMGVNLEYRWGWKAFAALYLAGAVIASLAYGLLHPGSRVGLVGASGAIAAAMGAFLVCLFKTKIRFVYVYFFFAVKAGSFEAPAYSVLPLWFGLELLALAGERAGAGGGVAHSAHVAGFVAGVIVGAVLKATGAERKLMDRRCQGALA
jgi:membrane associated rhomboid family serine protease